LSTGALRNSEDFFLQFDRVPAPVWFFRSAHSLDIPHGKPTLVRRNSLAEEDPDQAISDLHGITAQPNLRKRVIEQLVGDRRGVAVRPVRPAVIPARQRAAVVESDLSPAAALQAATINAEELLALFQP
jgi:hypothetical protein